MALTTVTEDMRKVPASLTEESVQQECNQQVEITVDSEIEERNLLRALGDECARNILLSMIDEPKSAIDITREKKIPISSVYRKIHWLENARLIKVKGFIITDDGKKYHIYQSRIGTIQISLLNNKIKVQFTKCNGTRCRAEEQEIPIN